MKLHRTASRLITVALLLATTGLFAPAHADSFAPIGYGEKVLAWRHTGSPSSFTVSQRLTSASGTYLTSYADSAWISHTVEAAVSTLRADTSAVFAVGGTGDRSLEDWAFGVGRAPTSTAGGAGDSMLVFQLVLRGTDSNGGSAKLTSQMGDSIVYVLQGSYDGGTTFQTIETNGYIAGGAPLKDATNAIGFTYWNKLTGFNQLGIPAETVPLRSNFMTVAPGIFRVIVTQQDWNGAVQGVIRYPKYLWAKGN